MDRKKESKQLTKDIFLLSRSEHPFSVQTNSQPFIKYRKFASDYILYGAALLKTGLVNASGEKTNVACLAKLEINVQVNAVRITVRATHPLAPVAIMQTVKHLLA